MKRVLILGAVLFIASTFTSFIEPRKAVENAMPFLVGYKTGTSTIYSETVTVWITYNPATDMIMDITALDYLGNPLTILTHNADDAITNSRQTIVATNLNVDVNINAYDYVILNGAFTPSP